MTRKIVVQASGGIESTTLLGKAIQECGRENVYPIALDSDSIFWKHRDAVAVKMVCTSLQLHQNLFICRMPQFDFLEYVKSGDYLDVGFIPGMKLLFNTASLAYAQRVGASEVWLGNMSDNVFPDESPEFLDDLSALYNRTYGMETGTEARLVAPFAGMSKGEVIQLAVDLGIDLSLTVSCGDERLAGGYNCGQCPWCLKRIAGFDEAEVPDPTLYMFGRGPR